VPTKPKLATTTTSNEVRLVIPGDPVPKSAGVPGRARGQWIFPPRYRAWRTHADKHLKKQRDLDHQPYWQPVRVSLLIVCRKPRTSKRDMPLGDVDNYAKAVLDAITQCKWVWHDDDLVQRLAVLKLFEKDAGHDPGCYITIRPYDHQSTRP
jgi:Holliday junction resolvase RusA-like endonuclease